MTSCRRFHVAHTGRATGPRYTDPMPLALGTRLGPYQILSAIGAGGMGEVYKATDTRLDRAVAVKVLPEHVAAQPEARQRFEREARAVSSLNHPHICILHDIGRQDATDYLVMEFLEGETLGARLATGPLPPDQLLRYAVEVADALGAAHRQGVYHRDLKPGNVMLTKAGSKLLDFGLAKLRGPQAASSSLSQLPTEAAAGLTAKGTILGTFQYMAPEQLEGKEADARSDIFAFGAVLYEMATGRKAFEGRSQASLITAIMSSEPPAISTLAPLTPPALERIVTKCLAKDPDERWQSAQDLAAELKWIAEAPASAPVAAPPVAQPQRPWAWIGLAAAGLLAAAALAVVHFREALPQARPVRFQIPPPERMSFRSWDMPVVSPDGERVVFSGATAARGDGLWLRSLDSLEARPIPGAEGGFFPFWSPDSRQIGFFTNIHLKKVDLAGGPAQTLCEAAAGWGGTWNRDGLIVFTPRSGVPLHRVSASGGEAKSLTQLDQSRGDVTHRFPSFLPDGRHFLYLVFSSQAQNAGVYLGSLDSKETRRLVAADGQAVYAPAASGMGYLVFPRGPALMAQPFDAKRLAAAGDPFPVVERVALGGTSAGAAFSASETGVLAYRTGGEDRSQLVWFDRAGKRLEALGEPADYSNPALSPDEKKVAVGIRNPQTRTRDLWVLDLARRTGSRLTFDAAEDLNPVFSPDGSRIAFSSSRKGRRDLYQKLASGTGDEELLLESGEDKNVEDWTRDGRFMVFNRNSQDVWALPLTGDRKAAPLLQGPFSEVEGQVSPDGRWIAYSSNESARREVYVQSFPPAGGKWQVSTAGGEEPRWRRDGKELFYVAGSKIMAVELKTNGPTFEAGIPKELFEVRIGPPLRNRILVTGDGKRFLVNTPVEETLALPMTVVLNWTAGARR